MTAEITPGTQSTKGGNSVALLGYNVVTVTGTYDLSTENSSTSAVATTVSLPTGFKPQAILGKECYVVAKTGDSGPYALTHYTPTVAFKCNSSTGQLESKIVVTPANSTPTTAKFTIFVLGQQ